jgi:5-methylcytosine-specific restriction endonuclease McrA
MAQGFDGLTPANSSTLSLLRYIRSAMDPEPKEDLYRRVGHYNRRMHFGAWVNSNSEADCLDTRNEVLVRDADQKVPIRFRKNTSCFVMKGRWDDPYTGRSFKLANYLHVDHVVPLKNAYKSGAHAWRPARRCHFANYLGNNFHLRAVSAHENMSKGEHGPDAYMPPNRKIHCSYLHDWMKIKMIWELSVTPDELNAIERHLQEKNCSASTVMISIHELTEERNASFKPDQKCQEFETMISFSKALMDQNL